MLADGNFLQACQSAVNGGGTDIVFIKTAPNGAQIWQKRFGGSGNNGVRALEPLPDGGWILAGFSSSMGSNLDPLAVRFSADGAVIWQKIMITAPDIDYFTDVKRTKDGQLILAGALHTASNQGWGAYLGKLDAGNGNVLWSRLYDNVRTDFIQGVTELASGDLIACGFTMSFGQNSSLVHDGMLLRTDAQGNLLWVKAIGTVSNEWLTNVFETPDGNLIATGSTSGWNGTTGGTFFDDGWLVKMAADGTVLWSNVYRSDQNIDYGAIGVVQNSDGSLVWAANDPANIGASRPHFFKTDAAGALEWSRIYNGTDAGRMLDVAALPDGYLFSGYYVINGSPDICLLKTDPAGFAGQCAETPHTLAVEPVQPLVVNGQLNTLPAQALQNANLTVGNIALPEAQYCLPDCIDPPPPCKSFQNTYGTSDNDRGLISIEMPGGGYLIGGTTTQYGNTDILLTRTDTKGEIQWSKRYDSGNLPDNLLDLHPGPNGGFFISFTLGNPSDAAFAICDPSGNILIAYRITTTAGSLTDAFYDITSTSDGGYLAAGAFSPDDNTKWAACFIKMDAAGTVQWSRGWNNPGTDFVTSIRELPDGGYIASGFGTSYGLGGPHDGTAYRIDSNGDLLWTKAYGTPTEGGFSEVAIAADGGFLFTAGLWGFGSGNYPEGGIVRTDANGNLIWTKLYRPSNNLDWHAEGIVNTADGNFVIIGQNRPNTTDTKAYILKINDSGEIIWTRQYGGPGRETLSDLRALTSGGFLCTGFTTSAGNGGEDFYVLHTDADGRAGLCPETPHTTAVVPLQITQTNGLLQEITPPALQALSLNVAPVNVAKTEMCPPDCSTPEICNNGLDDDADTLFDCLDLDCDCHSCDGSEAKIWYFGRQAGLDFSDNPPLVLTSGKTSTNEAAAVASDPLGQLIFYTDAKTVFQRNHIAMPNGSGLFGHTSSSQTIIVPHPGNPALFYVFTPDSYDNGPARGVSYSVVDMALNGGFGDVPAGQKNLTLTPASELVEQLSAVRHCNGADFWVLNHRKTSNAFLAYRIDQNGLNTTPVVSNTGTGGQAPNGNYDVIGQMKIAPDGLRLARALYHTNAVEVFDFDAATGSVSNPVLLQTPGLINPYGVEFSPTGRYLYATGLGNPSSLFQFDLHAGNAAAISATAVKLATFPGIYHYGQLQAAPNGKIYTTNSGPGVFTTQLGVIQFPDEAGANCLYQENGQTLGGTPGTNLSLPNFPVSYFWKPAIWFDSADLVDTICQTPQEQTFYLKKLSCGIQSVDWAISGSGTILNQSKETVTVRFDQAGQATLVAHAVAACGEAADTLQVAVLEPSTAVLNLGPDHAVCANGVTELDAGPGFQKYQWYDGSTGQTNTPAAGPGKYWVDVWDNCDNKQTDTLVIDVIPTTALDLGPDQMACAGSALLYELPAPFTAWHWYPDDHLSCADCHTVVSTAPVNTTYIVVGELAGGCLSADTLTIHIAGDTILSAVQLVACPGQTAAFNGQTLPPGGPYPFIFPAANGCDSTVLVTVQETIPATSSVQLVACSGQTAAFNGQTLPPGGPYPFIFPAANGCDSTVLVTVQETIPATSSVQLVACPGQTAAFNGQTLPPGGPYPFIFPAANGCDSTVLVTVQQANAATSSLQLVACPGQTAAFNGQNLPPGGPYPFIFPAANGCDSTVLVTVQQANAATSSVQLVACDGQPAFFNGQNLPPGGPYPFVFTAANGCDSTVLVTVQQANAATSSLQLVACPGQTAFFNGQNLPPGGPYPLFSLPPTAAIPPCSLPCSRQTPRPVASS
ncbi:MAG: hypothetical protein IPH12_02720 [Saprospirales bacterium]|nr:hypothetical protein [Saprospirales bacterium]